jgi:hypothetical protein
MRRLAFATAKKPTTSTPMDAGGVKNRQIFKELKC